MSTKHDQKVRISLKETFGNILPDLQGLDIRNIQLLVAIIIGIITVVWLLSRFFGVRSVRNAVVMLGLCESGKTELFSRLCYNADVVTVTSVEESKGYLKDGNKSTCIYDLPGHERIRYNIFDKLKSNAEKIMFMIDASTFQKDLHDVAEFLYTILCDASVKAGVKHLLIVCNKQDLATAKGAAIIQSSLEKEMNELRVTQSNQLQSIGGSEITNVFLGVKGKPFKFTHLKPMQVSFVEASVKGQLDDVKKWISAS